MSDTFDPFNLLLLAIAVVLFLRLRSVLGRRTGHERRPYDPYTHKESADQQPVRAGQDGNVVSFPRGEESGKEPAHLAPDVDAKPVWEGIADKDSALARALEDVRVSDHSFDPHQFLDGARAAYEMIVTAFAQGDRETLKSLLADDVYQGFNRVIDEREKAGHVMETGFVGIDEARIIGASSQNSDVSITVRFVSELITTTRDKDGKVVDGDPKRVREVTDVWTFSRDARSADPNWKLIATESPD